MEGATGGFEGMTRLTSHAEKLSVQSSRGPSADRDIALPPRAKYCVGDGIRYKLGLALVRLEVSSNIRGPCRFRCYLLLVTVASPSAAPAPPSVSPTTCRPFSKPPMFFSATRGHAAILL